MLNYLHQFWECWKGIWIYSHKQIIKVEDNNYMSYSDLIISQYRHNQNITFFLIKMYIVYGNEKRKSETDFYKC